MTSEPDTFFIWCRLICFCLWLCTRWYVLCCYITSVDDYVHMMGKYLKHFLTTYCWL